MASVINQIVIDDVNEPIRRLIISALSKAINSF